MTATAAAPATSTNLWIGGARRTTARIRLFCFPFAGGGAGAFRGWANLLPFDVDVCPLQLPGRERRIAEAPARNLTKLVEDLTDAIRPALDRPFVFFGHSLGAIVAFETARQLRRAGGPRPMRLFLSGHGPVYASSREEPFHLMPQQKFLDSVAAFGGLPQALLQNRDLLELMLPVLRADFEMYETHRHVDEHPLDIPFTAMGGLTDKAVPESHLRAWSGETSAAFHVKMFPGGHFFLNDAAHLVLHSVSAELAGVNARLAA